MSIIESGTLPTEAVYGLSVTIFLTNTASLVMRLKLFTRATPSFESAAFDTLSYCAEQWRNVWCARGQHPAPEDIWSCAQRELAQQSAQHDKLLRETRLAVIFDQSFARGNSPAFCLLLAPKAPEGVSIIYSTGTDGHILATRHPVSISVICSNQSLVEIPVWGLSIYGRFQYQEISKALAPAAVASDNWKLLAEKKQPGFSEVLRLAGALCLLAGGLVWLSLSRATGTTETMAALVAAAGATLLLAGELFKVEQIWLKRIARWIAVVAPAMVIELATAMLTLGIEHIHASPDAPQHETVAGAALLVIGCFSFWIIIRLWPMSRESRRWLVPPENETGA
jgi:hypothetical protein